MEYPIRAMTLGGVLDQAITLTKNHFGKFFLISCVLLVPLELIFLLTMAQYMPALVESQASGQMNTGAAVTVFAIVFIFIIAYGLFVYPITNAAMIRAISSEYLGKPVSAGDALREAFKMLGNILGTSILAGLVIFGGLVLLVIPGIYLALKYFFMIQVVVLERKSGSDALKRSGELMKGHFGTLIVLLLVIGIGNKLIETVTGVIPVLALQIVASVVVETALGIFTSAVGVVLYFSARCKHENFDLAVLADSVAKEPSVEAAP